MPNETSDDVTATGWTPDLSGQRGARYTALANAIGSAIAAGELRAGERLPPRRELAHRLGLSVNTVSSAYVEAQRRGYVVGEVGRGTYVRADPDDPDRTFSIGVRPGNLIDLSICRPCRLKSYNRCVQSTLGALGRMPDQSAMLACRPIVGFESHRAAATRWLARLGIEATPDQVVLTNGSQHALLVTLSTLVEPGAVVATEALTDHGTIALATILHFHLLGLPIDEHGIIPDGFDAACRSNAVKALITTPTLNNPTCSLMPEDRRRRIVAIARERGVAIIENGVFNALVDDGPPPLCALYRENGYFITSFTKCAMSGLRVGYLVGPERDVPRLAARVRSTSWMATPLVCEIAAQWIADGTMVDLVQAQKQELAARQQFVARAMHGCEHRNHPTGHNVWLPLPNPWRAENFVAQARVRGVSVARAEPFVVGRLAEPHAVRLSVGAAHSRSELESGLREVADLLQHSVEPAVLQF